MQSWFVVSRTRIGDAADRAQANFTTPRTQREIDGAWQATFDPRWGGPDGTVSFERLNDWSKHSNPQASTWKDFETLAAWPDWFKARQPRPSGRSYLPVRWSQLP